MLKKICIFFASLIYLGWCWLILLKPHLIVVWLQNSDELRATGGFLGSVVWIETSGIIPISFELKDIYELDNHLRTYVEAPDPVKNYLSSGGSWRFTDVNWDRDFPTSATRFNEFLKLTDLPSADLIVALDLNFAERLIDYIGGLDLKSNEQILHLTSDNFAEVARTRRYREDFYDFPKMDLLRTAASSMWEKFNNFSLSQKLDFIVCVGNEIKTGAFKFYANNNLLQRFFVSQKITGHTIDQHYANNVYIFDSNVGINKVNRYIDSYHQINHLDDKQINIKINWQNNCPLQNFNEANCTYANYFRLLLDDDIQLKNVYIFDEEIVNFDTRVVTDAQNKKWTEIGFLTMLPPSETLVLNIVLQGQNLEWIVDR